MLKIKARHQIIMTLLACPTCGDTYLVYDGEQSLCKNCKAQLVETCEWCGKPEKECKCGKDEIDTEQIISE